MSLFQLTMFDFVDGECTLLSPAIPHAGLVERKSMKNTNLSQLLGKQLDMILSSFISWALSCQMKALSAVVTGVKQQMNTPQGKRMLEWNLPDSFFLLWGQDDRC